MKRKGKIGEGDAAAAAHPHTSFARVFLLAGRTESINLNFP